VKEVFGRKGIAADSAAQEDIKSRGDITSGDQEKKDESQVEKDEVKSSGIRGSLFVIPCGAEVKRKKKEKQKKGDGVGN